MKESLYYLFLSGLILGSGPCIFFCAPIIAGFIAAYKPSFKKAVIFYGCFSLAKLASYMIIGALCGAFAGVLKSNIYAGYINVIQVVLGIFVLTSGILTVIIKQPLNSKYCSFLSRGNLRNAGVLGLLAGFVPCLPLLGILNYIIIISRSPIEGLLYAFVFGLGTSLSPVSLLAGLACKLAGSFSNSNKIKILSKVLSGVLLV